MECPDVTGNQHLKNYFRRLSTPKKFELIWQKHMKSKSIAVYRIDDKLIGAVTHIFVNEPTRGYGIFIENMLSEAEKVKQERSSHVKNRRAF